MDTRKYKFSEKANILELNSYIFEKKTKKNKYFGIEFLYI